MKNYLLFFLFIILTQLTVGQQRGIQMTKIKNGKQRFIKEHQRVKVKLLDGRVFSGKYHIEGEHIFIKGQKIPFESIYFIKKHPLLQSVLTQGFLIYGGVLAVGFGALIGVLVDSAGYYLIVPGAIMIYAGTKSPNLNRSYKKDKKWTLELIKT